MALAQHALNGFPHATAEEQSIRRAVCGPCWRRDKVKDVCTICTCRLGESGILPNKVRWAGEQCPLYDPAKHTEPHHLWGPVKGERIWTRWWRRMTGR